VCPHLPHVYVDPVTASKKNDIKCGGGGGAEKNPTSAWLVCRRLQLHAVWLGNGEIRRRRCGRGL